MTGSKGGLMFRLGQFVGGITRGVTTPIDKPRRQTIRTSVEQHTTRQADATVTLRRTTIEEIEVRSHAPRDTP